MDPPLTKVSISTHGQYRSHVFFFMQTAKPLGSDSAELIYPLAHSLHRRHEPAAIVTPTYGRIYVSESNTDIMVSDFIYREGGESERTYLSHSSCIKPIFCYEEEGPDFYQ